MIDLTEIVDKVARATWDGTQPPREPDIDFDQLHPHEQLTIKSALLPTISKTAELVEEAVREQIAARFDLEDEGAYCTTSWAAQIARGEK